MTWNSKRPLAVSVSIASQIDTKPICLSLSNETSTIK